MLGWYESERNLCIAMEYFPEGDLQSYLRDRARLNEGETREVISQVLQGLAIMHKSGLAHRDIKPQVRTFIKSEERWYSNLDI
jgi:serine/threonine protein kinase